VLFEKKLKWIIEISICPPQQQEEELIEEKTMASMKKKTTVNVKSASQHYCATCGVICGEKYNIGSARMECARSTELKRVHCCSMTCCKALLFKQHEETLIEIIATLRFWYKIVKDEISKDIMKEKHCVHKKKFPKQILLLCKSFKVQIQICDLLLKHDWVTAGFMFQKNKDLFTEGGEEMLHLQGGAYMLYLNRVKAIQSLGENIMNVLVVDEDARKTQDTGDLWK